MTMRTVGFTVCALALTAGIQAQAQTTPTTPPVVANTPAPAAGQTAQRREVPKSLQLERVKVNVHLQNPSITQLAKALADSTGLLIRADRSIPTDIHLTLDTVNAPLVDVLSVVAEKCNLEIDRQGDAIILKACPSILVGRSRSAYKGPLYPWSDAWVVAPDGTGRALPGVTRSQTEGLPGYVGGIGGSGVDIDGTFVHFPRGSGGAMMPDGEVTFVPEMGAAITIRPDRKDMAPMPKAQQGDATPAGTQTREYIPLSGAFNGLFAMTSLGDHLVLAEPGTGPNGERGVILTVYAWDPARQQLRRITSIFHRIGGGMHHTGVATPVR